MSHSMRSGFFEPFSSDKDVREVSRNYMFEFCFYLDFVRTKLFCYRVVFLSTLWENLIFFSV